MIVYANSIVQHVIHIKNKYVMSTASIGFHSEKVEDCYILHTLLLVIILLLMIIIITCYFYAKQKGTWKIINIKKFVLKIVRVIISMT